MEKSREEFKQVIEAAKIAPRGSVKREESTKKIWSEFAASMEDDLQTPKALAILLGVCKALGEAQDKSELGALFWEMIETLGFRLF